MNRLRWPAMATTLLLIVPGAFAGEPTANPAKIVDTMEKNFGVHPGFRRNHAKGVCATGTFAASKEARALTMSDLFDGKDIPVVARFSIAGGVPAIPDASKAPHGLALQFTLPGNRHHNMSMLNVPIFAVATPEAFQDFLVATAPATKDGGPDMIKVKAFIDAHPEIQPFLAAVNGANAPASYATANYFSLHAFKFTNAKNKSQFVRWRFEPKGGEVRLTDAEAKKATADFLEADLEKRVGQAPAEWTMIATLAGKDDSLTNASSPWGKDRKEVNMGTLKLAHAMAQADGPCEKINFDPTSTSKGVAISADPVLRFRSAAYAISYGKRISEPAVKTERTPSSR